MPPLRAQEIYSCKQVQSITKEDFSLPTFGPTLKVLVDDGVHGRGFQMLRQVEISS